MRHGVPFCCCLLLSTVLGMGLVRAQTAATTQLQLLEGVRLFRAEQYEASLRVFQKIDGEQQPADIGFYLGMALHKLGRHLPAVTAFRAAQRSGLREPVADYYLAVSCYRLGMHSRARHGFAALITPTSATSATTQSPLPLGPRLQQGARSFLSAIQQAMPEQASESSSGTYTQHYEQARQNSERLLVSDDLDGALEWLDEAARIVQENPEQRDRLQRSNELRSLLSQLRGKLGPRAASTDVLSIEKLLAT